jgi:hypothetical protein
MNAPSRLIERIDDYDSKIDDLRKKLEASHHLPETEGWMAALIRDSSRKIDRYTAV